MIEKMKTGSRDDAGKFDLYKDDKTGEIVVSPKSGEEDGSPTGYNVKGLNEVEDN